MKRVSIELESGKKKVEIPQSWDEIDLKTFIRIEKEFEYDFSKLITLFSILTGIPLKPLEQSQQNDLDLLLFQLMQFISKPPGWEELPKPEKVVIKGQVIKCRYDFATTSLGQKLTMDTLVRDSETAVDAIPEVIAIFLQPTIDGEYNRDKMLELKEEVLNLPCKQAFGYAQFFFLRSKHLKRFGLKDLVNQQKKKKPMLRWREVQLSSLSLQ